MSSIIFLIPDTKIHGSMKGTGIGGAHNTTIQLANALAKRGHHVECFTGLDLNEKYSEIYEDVFWANKPRLDNYDLSVVNLYPFYLNLVSSKRKAVWIHNPMNRWSRFRKSVKNLIVHRPTGIFLSQHQYNTTPWFVPYAGRHIIEHGIEDIFLKSRQIRKPPKPIALFTSASERNLDLVIEQWISKIHPQLREAELHIYSFLPLQVSQSYNYNEHNIHLKGRVPHSKLMNALYEARIWIYPGHKEETFCSAAHEATACGLPIVTMGIGALCDRVTHNSNGLVATTKEEMGDAILELLRDDEKWSKLHEGALNFKGFYSWDNRAELWENIFL